MKLSKPVTIDFETFGIEGRPAYPPVPVGVSIKKWGKASRYYAWGHKGGNNATLAQATAALRAVWDNPDGLLFHNSKFDLDVAETHIGLKMPTWERTHDSVYLLYLDNPHSRALGLKPAAWRLLNMPPDERDVVADWLLEHQPVPGVKIGKSENSKEPAGKYIAYAPGDVVGPYANGDTDRTEALFRHLYPSIVARGMLAAYDRERRLMPILLDMERRGVPVDLPRLRRETADYGQVLDEMTEWVRAQLGITHDINLSSGQQLLKVLEDAGALDRGKLRLTKPNKKTGRSSGRVSADKESLAGAITDPTMGAVLKYMAQLRTCLQTFMRPWLSTAELSGGLIFTTWNQTRGAREKGGTRTGRLSSSPNFQNIPKEFDPIFRSVENPHLPPCPWADLPPLPLCRGYVVPLPGCVLVGRDYSQQEPRILAHFEDGELLRQYQENPWIDYHDNAKEHLERMFKRPFKRKAVKTVNLSIIYGQGVPSLAEKIGETVQGTTELRNAIYGLYPGLKNMNDDMKARARAEQPIRTWGGREYYCEPPIIMGGRIVKFDYKMVNVLVQGSAADCTKEALVRFSTVMRPTWQLLLQVHDEIVVMAPAVDLAAAQEALRVTMESVEFDVKILSEGAWSAENWAAMVDYDKKGVVLYQEPKRKRKAA